MKKILTLLTAGAVTLLAGMAHADPVTLSTASGMTGSTTHSATQTGVISSGIGSMLDDRIRAIVQEEIRKAMSKDESIDIFFNKKIADLIAKNQNQQQATQKERLIREAKMARNYRPIDKTKDHIYGNPDAPISLVEYSDFECPYCKRFHETARQLVDESNGQVNWVYRHFPLQFHDPMATQEAMAAECAAEQGGNAKFWAMTDAIYAQTATNGKGTPSLDGIATSIGIDAVKMNECINSGRMAGKVKADHQNGLSAGIQGTPGNILVDNNTGRAIPSHGARPIQAFHQAIEQLKQSPDSVAIK